MGVMLIVCMTFSLCESNFVVVGELQQQIEKSEIVTSDTGGEK